MDESPAGAVPAGTVCSGIASVLRRAISAVKVSIVNASSLVRGHNSNCTAFGGSFESPNVYLLLSAGCDPSVKDMHGNMAIHYAAGNGYQGVLEAIEKVGGDMELLDGSGRTAVEWARERGAMEVVRVLKRKRMVRGEEGGGGGRGGR